MANHKSAQKRIRSSRARRLRNRLQKSVVKAAVKKFKAAKNQEEAKTAYPRIASLVDRLAKRNIIHKNKASNLKSKMAKFVNRLATV